MLILAQTQKQKLIVRKKIRQAICPSSSLQGWVCILPVNQMGETGTFDGSFSRYKGFVSHREKPTQSAQAHQQWGTEWQEISWALGDNATPPSWHKESLSPKHGLVEKESKCRFNYFHHLAHVNQNSLNLEGLLHPFQITSRWPWRPWCIWTWPPAPPSSNNRHPRLMPVSALHLPRAKIQEIKQHTTKRLSRVPMAQMFSLLAAAKKCHDSHL